MATYAKIKELKNKENKNVIQALKYIAEEEGYMKGGDIEYRKLYYDVLKYKFSNTAKTVKTLNSNGFKVSYRQYKRLRIYRRGKFSIHTAIYFLALYEVMYGYKKNARLGKAKHDISYTTYIANVLKEEIQTILTFEKVEPVLRETFENIYNDFLELDEITGSRSRKIYNNIW